jgi:enoyl-CoA hydratase/carnithine racemase
MSLETLLYSASDNVATITINRPDKLNALNAKCKSELTALLAEVRGDAGIRAVILTGAGPKAFMAGTDIGELAPLDTTSGREFSAGGQSLFDAIQDLGKPVIAAVNGYALGGGCELALACHIRVAADTARFGQPEVNLGIIPGYGGTQRMPRLIGVERGLDLLRTGRSIGAKEACEWGWATGKPEANVLAAAKDLVRQHIAGKVKLAPVNPEPKPVPDKIPAVDIAHRSRKIDAILVDVVRGGLAKPLSEGLRIEADGFEACRRTIDMDIGMKNFIQNGPRVPAAFLHE